MSIRADQFTHAIPSSWFTYVKESRHFVADASDLGCDHAMYPMYPIYDGASGDGIAIRSTRTGRVVIYSLYRVERDPDGDVLFWLFEPIPEHRGHAAGTEVRIYND